MTLIRMIQSITRLLKTYVNSHQRTEISDITILFKLKLFRAVQKELF